MNVFGKSRLGCLALQLLFLCFTLQQLKAGANEAPQPEVMQASGAYNASGSCPPLNRNTLKSSLATRKQLRLVFFSTWCSDCAKHLQDIPGLARLEPVLAVAVFDTQKKVEATLSRMQLNIPCVMDDGLAKSLGVNTVPSERMIALTDL